MYSYFLLSSGGGELFASQHSTISRQQASALPPTTTEGNQVKDIIKYSIDDESLIREGITHSSSTVTAGFTSITNRRV